MQRNSKKNLQFRKAVGNILANIRKQNTSTSRSTFAREYDLDRGNLSKTERGLTGCTLSTAWRITEATGVKFSEFAKMLEDELGEDFKLMDE